MRNIEYIENELKSKQAYLEKIDSLSLGFLLKGLYYSSSEIKDFVSNGVFKITFNCHSTGVSTDSYIIKPDNSLYQIAHRTYWYNESQYGFNEKWYKNGAWDEKYQDFIKELQNQLKKVTEDKINLLIEEKAYIESKLQDEKSAIESMFL